MAAGAAGCAAAEAPAGAAPRSPAGSGQGDQRGEARMRMKDKVAVITGGASGIGKRTVERFLEEGGRAVVADIQDAAGMRLWEALGPAARFIHCDVTREEDIA